MFLGHIKQNMPDYLDLLTNPKRGNEKAQYMQNVMSWIEGKPYKEASKLMEIALRGRDPRQVCDLINRFESERKGGRPDATGAFAVPSPGAPAAQSGFGGKDDFEVGWNL